MRIRTGLTLVLALCVALTLVGCGAGPEKDATSPQGEVTSTPVQADPLSPVDDAQKAADDANAVIQDQSSEIDELTDGE